MRSFSDAVLGQLEIPVALGWLMGVCMEGKGKQELWYHSKPEVLEALRQLAIIQSAESSNRIEGVTVQPRRLRPILLEDARPIDRSEEELVGYRKALDWIHTSHADIPVSVATIKRLHELAQGGFSADAGAFKTRSNEIIELLPDGTRRVRFVPVVPRAMKQLCLGYQDAWQQGRLPPLLAAAALAFDLLCIHPFRDGNGRVSRLLTLLALYQHGFEVGRFISLERIVEDHKVTYYEALAASSAGWHDAEHSLVPWWSFFLSMVKQAHSELDQRLEVAGSGVGKTELVRRAVLSRTGAFTLSEIVASCPSVSTQLVKRVLSELKGAGKVTLSGHGRGARWRIV